jgi:hypothetical protein
MRSLYKVPFQYFLPFITIFPVALHAQWERSSTTGLPNSWSDVAYGEGVFVAVNGFGRIAVSTDGGQSFTLALDHGWAIEDIEYGFNGSEMAFWATGRSSGDFLLESIDGGQTWTDIAGNYSFPFSDGGADIVLDGEGNLIYTRLRGNNNIGDAFLFNGVYYAYGSGPDSSVLSSTDGGAFSETVGDSGLWLLGGIDLGGQALVYGSTFLTPGDFSTRRGVIYDPTTDPSSPVNPTVIEPTRNSYIVDIDPDPVSPATLYSTGAGATLTSTDNGATWSVDEVAEGTTLSDLSAMAIGPESRVVVGATGIYFYPAGNQQSEVWGGFSVVDGFVNTADWIGWLDVQTAPWVFSYSLEKYLFVTEPNPDSMGGWIFVPAQ